MPKFLLTRWQVNSLIEYGSLPAPGPGSPLRVLAPSKRPLAPGDPDFAQLVEQSLLREDGRGGWRTNFALLPFLGAALQPHEVISLGVGAGGGVGFTVARHNDVLVEATVGPGGTTKIEFPLTRTAAVLTIIGALSGDRPEPATTGFRFVGDAADVFVLAAALRAIRLDGLVLTVDRLREAVRRDLGVTALAAPFAVAGAPEEIALLATRSDAVDDAIERLLDAGYLTARLDRLEPSEQVMTVLSGEPTAVMGVGRTVVADGRARSTSITATRIGERILSFRVQSRPDAAPRFEWMEVSREQLRWLVFAVLLPDADVERLRAGESIEQVTAPTAVATDEAIPVDEAPAASDEPSAQPTTATAAPSPEPAEAAPPPWAPTHTVPEQGLAAFGLPDPTSAPVATLDPWLPVQVDERRGDWAHAVCSNGWSCWVDGRHLVAGS